MKNENLGVIGSGRVATHFMNYLNLSGMNYINWSRKKDIDSPEIKLKDVSIIIILISDDAIEEFIKSHPKLREKTLIHFSGTLSINGIISLHPLMTFSKNLYDFETYKSIPFIGIEGEKPLKTLLPELQNPYFTIKAEDKGVYHALCVISGNFTTILWQKAKNDFNNILNLPPQALDPYMNQIFNNLTVDYKNALTGPIKRGDKKTIRTNIKSLQSKVWKNIYKLFKKAYNKELK